MFVVCGEPCRSCGDATRATEVDRYHNRQGQVTTLKLRCSLCRDVWLVSVP